MATYALWTSSLRFLVCKDEAHPLIHMPFWPNTAIWVGLQAVLPDAYYQRLRAILVIFFALTKTDTAGEVFFAGG
jgi:hypothetical protein